MTPTLLFAAVVDKLQSFDQAALFCGLVAEGAHSRPFKTSVKNFVRFSLHEAIAQPRRLQRAAEKLSAQGFVDLAVHPNTRTTFTVPSTVLDEMLDAAEAVEAIPERAEGAKRLGSVMHQLLDYDDALVLCRLLDLPADELPSLKTSKLIEPLGQLMDRFRARRALYRLADRGLVSLAPKDRSGLSIALNAGAAAELLARPLPNLRYLRPDAFASQPYFIARAARLASAGADGQSVELGAADLAVSDVESRADLSAAQAQAAAVDDAASTSLST